MFYLYKLAGSLVVPPGLLCIVLILFAYLAWRKPRKKILALLLIVFSAALWFMSAPFGAHCITGPLENMYSRQLPPKRTPCAVLVLSGGSTYDVDGRPQPGVFALERVVCGVKIARELNCPLILSGGNVYGLDDKSEAEVMEDCARKIGWTGKTYLDKKSRTTKENLLYTKQLLNDRSSATKQSLNVRSTTAPPSLNSFSSVVLVTNAFHMPRSVYCAQRYIPEVKLYPYSSGTLTNTRQKGIPNLLPDAGSLMATCLGIKEWIGMAVYKIH
ncbi:MAG: ElyC/SanA/YdcF family protein [Synergistaceae bacterium]|nr:ElyC/SanA/YdcF family protein [Synergistaceae bacterium]